MNMIHITPGAGGMYCGNCFRDNALVGALRRLGHSSLLVPLYLPMTLDEEDQSGGTPIFFGGINVYLEQQGSWFRRMPGWLHRMLASPRLLKWAAGRAAKTRADQVADMTISMLKGEEGNQARELDELVGFLESGQRPDILFLSNALLLGLARRIRERLGIPVACVLQGEDSFVDSLPEPHRGEAWRIMAERAREVDLFLAPTRYFGDLMSRRLQVDPAKVRTLFNGIHLDGFHPSAAPPDPPVLGYFARMCPAKGLDTLVDAYLILLTRGRVPELRLHVGGGCGPGDEPFVASLKRRIRDAGAEARVSFFPNVSRPEKLEFLRSLTVFSVPALYGEAFGLYLIEAMASGVPVVQPRHAGFPEVIDAAGGGILCEPGDPAALADGIERVLLDSSLRDALSQHGREAVVSRFSVESAARSLVEIVAEVRSAHRPSPGEKPPLPAAPIRS